MEDGASSILYIIISVIIILVGILGKKKKPQQVPGGSDNKEPGIMDFFDKLGLADTEKEREEFIDIEEEEETKVAPTVKDHIEKKSEVTEQISEVESEEKKAFEISDEFDYETDEIKDEFDLKKAIIYSEIINRKYE